MTCAPFHNVGERIANLSGPPNSQASKRTLFPYTLSILAE